VFSLSTLNNANAPMQGSLLHYTRTFLLPLLAVGMVFAGCDSSGSNGIDDGNGNNGDNGGDGITIQGSFPEPTAENSYAEEVAINLQSAGLGIRMENDPSASVLQEIYTGPASDRSIRLISGSSLTFTQSTYGELGNGVNLSDAISKADLVGSDALEEPDSPNPGTPQNADDLVGFYIDQAQHTSSNGVDFSQLTEKGIASALTYAEGAQILSDFATESVESNRADKWNEAFGHFGAPRDFAAFLDYNADGGLASGSFQDVNGDNSVDLTSEAVYIWAGYTAERAAAAEATGNPNDFARRAFEAFREGREEIADGNDVTDQAETALDAWEATVAVNVIHYTNSLKSALESVNGEITRDAIDDTGGFQDAWGEAKAFAWTLQFESELSDSELETIHDQIGNDPPYGEGVDASTYTEDLNAVQQTLQDAYDFEDDNVQAW